MNYDPFYRRFPNTASPEIDVIGGLTVYNATPHTVPDIKHMLVKKLNSIYSLKPT